MQTGNKPLLGENPDLGHPLTNGLIGCWLFRGGNLDYDMASGNNLIHTNVTFPANYISYNGSSSTTQNYTGYTIRNPLAGLGAGAGAVAMRARINTDANIKYLFATTDSSDNAGVLFRQLDTTELQILAYNTSGTLVVNQTTGDGHFTVGQWYDWVMTWNSSASYLYEDGQVVLSDTAITGPIRDVEKFLMGYYSFNYISADVQFCYLYNRSLTRQEVLQLYNDPYCMFERRDTSKIYVSAVTKIPLFMHHYKQLGAA